MSLTTLSHQAMRGEKLKETAADITRIKAELGARLLVLTHHYQRREVVRAGDYVGDSFMLSKKAAENQDAEYIVFCGVHFMAESARVLARPGQRVFHPNLESGCPMAEMGDAADAERGWGEISAVLGVHPMPVAYMNTVAAVKALVGKHGGAVCTSSNAGKIMRWSLDHGRPVLFIPDEHLGRNTALALGLGPAEMVLWDYTKPGGGVAADDLRRAKVILWKGHCHVHTWFTTEHVREIRDRYPGVKVVVHPECEHEVVAVADVVGSTELIARYVRDAAPGVTIAIGTEVNLISRLAEEHPDKTVIPLSRSLCPNMFRISLGHLHRTLLNLPEHNEIHLDGETIAHARLALERMLTLN